MQRKKYIYNALIAISLCKRNKNARMRRYEITARVGLDMYRAVVEAKNIKEANEMALSMGHKLSNYGKCGSLRGVSVEAIKPK